MNESLVKILKINTALTTKLASDLSEHELSIRFPAQGHDARWVIGHMGFMVKYAAEILKVEVSVPDAWGELFAPGSAGHGADPEIVSKEELLEVIDLWNSSIVPALVVTDLAATDVPHGSSFLSSLGLDTWRDTLTHLCSAHFAFHVGQLSVIRRALGRPHLF